VGLRLRHHREQVGLSQTQVASVIDVSLSAVSMWEQGHREPGYEKLLRLASIYGVSVGDFFHDGWSAASAEVRMLEARVAALERALKRLRA
jgi:transcriptional regulator with XRE-family HTH domain